MQRKLAAILLAVAAYNAFYFASGLPLLGTLGFALTIILIQAFLWLAFFPKTFTKKQEHALATSSVAILACLIAIFRASPIDALLLSFLSCGLSLISLYLLALTHYQFGAISELIYVPFAIAKHWFIKAIDLVDATPKLITKIFKDRNRISNSSLKLEKSTTIGLIRGAIITAPVVLIILIALIQADPIFSKLVSETLNKLYELVKPLLELSIPRRLIASLFVALLTTPVALMTIRRRFRSPLTHPHYQKYRIEVIMLVIVIALVLASFLIVQFRYLFATIKETELHQFGVQTYSEYVRRGFFELTFVSVIVYLAAVVSLVVLRNSPPQKPDFLLTANLVLLSETVIFIISILRRVFLYQIHHGLTRVRFYGTAFLSMLIALTLVLILRHAKGLKFNWYKFETSIALATVLFVTLLNPDKLIATKFKPTVNQETDYAYIARLSANAIDGWLEAYQEAEILNRLNQTKDPELISPDETRRLIYAKRAVDSLRLRYSLLIQKYGTSQELSQITYPEDSTKLPIHFKGPAPKEKLNIAEFDAYQKLKSYIPPQEISQLAHSLFNLLSNIPQQNHPQNLDRSTDTPLVKWY
jgi:hypothetical protein